MNAILDHVLVGAAIAAAVAYGIWHAWQRKTKGGAGCGEGCGCGKEKAK